MESSESSNLLNKPDRAGAECVAHIRENGASFEEQSLFDHSRNVAKYAAEKLDGIGLYHTGYLAGLLHDMGKATKKYRNYIEKASRGEKVIRGSVNHTFCALIYLFESFHTGADTDKSNQACEIIAAAVSSHHGEFDCMAPDGSSGFYHRMQADLDEICYLEAVDNFLAECASADEISKEFDFAQKEINKLLEAFEVDFNASSRKNMFLTGLLYRMILSALIDADRRDTAEFMKGKEHRFVKASKELWTEQLSFLEKKIQTFDKSGDINKARRLFSDKCAEFGAEKGGGIYRLTLPTGSGKTLSSLRYALTQAAAFNKKRIFYVIPLLTIIEQNSKVLRNHLKDPDILTEHHSNVINTNAESSDQGEKNAELEQYELICESWEAPVIITTLFQFLEALFSGKTTAIRRMSALSDSVIIIDEIQSLPRRITNLFNMALNFLACYCGASVVLSSATQPCFDETALPLKFSQPSEIVCSENFKDGKALFDAFKRTTLVNETNPYGRSIEEAADFSLGIIEEASSLLIVCNTKKSAYSLFKELKQRKNGIKVFHLSTSMCLKHRRDIFQEITDALDKKEKMVCISTQLVEAGVDFSFESAIRITAGIDNLVQTIGRCNRSNEFEKLCSVYLMNLKRNAENLSRLPEISSSQNALARVLVDFEVSPEKYYNDLVGDEAIKQYYSFLFGNQDVRRNFSYPVKCNMTDTYLFDLLSVNNNFKSLSKVKGKYLMHQSFKTAGKLFNVFDTNTVEIIVPYKTGGREVIANLSSEKAKFDYDFLKQCIEEAKAYTLQIFEYQRKNLEEDGMLYRIKDIESRYNIQLFYLNEHCYSEDCGLEIEGFETGY